MYNHHRTNHSRLLNREFLQKIILCFLIGFLCGAVFYYCFQNSFREILQATLENNTKTWTKETAFFPEWIRSLWNHGKYFALMWLLAVSPAGPVSQKIFVVYTGIRNGFLFVFFLYAKSAFGIIVYFASLIPQVFLLAPLYLFLFYVTTENRQPKLGKITIVLMIFTFLTACLIEVKWNLPLMKKIL